MTDRIKKAEIDEVFGDGIHPQLYRLTRKITLETMDMIRKHDLGKAGFLSVASLLLAACSNASGSTLESTYEAAKKISEHLESEHRKKGLNS